MTELGDLADYDFYDKFTLAAWVRPAGSTGGIISRYLPTPKGYGFFLIDGSCSFAWTRLAFLTACESRHKLRFR